MQSRWTRCCAVVLVYAATGCSGDPISRKGDGGSDGGGKTAEGRRDAGRMADAGRMPEDARVRDDADGSRAHADAASDATGRDAETDSGGSDTCTSSNITVTRVIPSVMLLIDGSTSMEVCYGSVDNSGVACPADSMAIPPLPAGTISRWGAVRSAITDPTNGVVARLQDRIKFGVAVFGTQPTCPLPIGVVAPALDNAAAIASNLPAAPVGLLTPTGPALDQIVDMLPDAQSTLDPTLGPQIVVLATDGDPNQCGDDVGTVPMTDYAPSLAAALKLQSKHQRMYVIGVGDDVSQAHLQEMANIGAGLPMQQKPGADVYRPEDPDALVAVLESLIGHELSCDLSLSGAGIDEDNACKGTVTLNGQQLACQGDDGWVFKDTHHITLQGAACEAFKNSADATVHADFPCEEP
jgi:hypothetical protein